MGAGTFAEPAASAAAGAFMGAGAFAGTDEEPELKVPAPGESSVV
jgi:hypothetical protein